MKKIISFNRKDKWLQIINYKSSWKENHIKPSINFRTNGAIKGKDSCLDVTLTIGYIVFNYTNFNYSKAV